MFQLIKGASISDITGLKEEYQITENQLRANVSAEKILIVFDSFLSKMREDEPLFLFIETPCSEDDEIMLNDLCSGNDNAIEKYHKDVYYLDGFYREHMLTLLHSGAGELLINDGLTNFGIGSFDSNIELGKYKYNVFIGYLHGQDAGVLTDIFDELGIPRVSEIVTAWELISEDNPGECRKYECYNKDIFVLVNQMKDLGLYKAETREDN